MAYSGQLLTIGNQVVTGLKSYDIQYAKLWKDSERNMSGNISSSLIGIFTKLQLEFADGRTEAEVATLISLFNQAYFNVTYFDMETQDTKTEKFYASDFDISMLEKSRGLYKGFSVNLIACQKR